MFTGHEQRLHGQGHKNPCLLSHLQAGKSRWAYSDDSDGDSIDEDGFAQHRARPAEAFGPIALADYGYRALARRRIVGRHEGAAKKRLHAQPAEGVAAHHLAINQLWVPIDGDRQRNRFEGDQISEDLGFFFRSSSSTG